MRIHFTARGRRKKKGLQEKKQRITNARVDESRVPSQPTLDASHGENKFGNNVYNSRLGVNIT